MENRSTVCPWLLTSLFLADAGYCSIAGIEYVQRENADVLVRVNPGVSWHIRHPAGASACYHGCELCPKSGRPANGGLSCMVDPPRLQAGWGAVRNSDHAMQQAHRRWLRRASRKPMATRPGRLEFANYVLVFTTRPRCSASEVLIRTSISFI
jgi:hypothetical protein